MKNLEIEELESLREQLKEQQKQYSSPLIEVGDFTYGVPDVKSWDNKTRLKIGKFCSIAENVSILLGGEHRTNWITTYPFNALLNSFQYIEGHPSTKGNIYIGNDVWLASGVKILSGVSIGDGAIVGANTVVSKDVPPYSIAIGNPMRIVKYRFSKREIKFLLKTQWWNLNDEQLIEIIPYLQSENLEALKKIIRKFNGV